VSPMDRISADGLAALLQMCDPLTVITSCDSVALASTLISASHVVAARDMVSSKMMAAWVEAFYGTLPHQPLSEALEFAMKSRCYMPGLPRATYMPYPFQIIQSQKDVMFAYEYATTNRVVNMGPPKEAAVDTWMGTSNGRWQGDTLVVDVTGFNGKWLLSRKRKQHHFSGWEETVSGIVGNRCAI